MPGAGFKRYALVTRKAVREMLDQPYELVKQRMVWLKLFIRIIMFIDLINIEDIRNCATVFHSEPVR